ncbi:MAG: hypothetical protein HFJ55_02160 [Clostridia bacterium]|jgi:hypothetical protein|nr:hypothetical protein [Clostridia bacterium]
MKEIKEKEQLEVKKSIETFPTYEILATFEINDEEYAICKKREVKCENKTTRQNI